MSFESIQMRIVQAAQRAGRCAKEIRLVVVTKNQPLEKIQLVYQQGQRDFAENRVQALLQKKPHLPKDIQWHLIGPLQTNKVRKILPHISFFQAVDRVAILPFLVREASQPLNCLLEVKIAQEESKHGLLPHQVEDFLAKWPWDSSLRLRGLMGMATFTSDTKQVRKEFQQLHRLYVDLKPHVLRKDPAAWDTLSMGMSQDFEIAIEEGATMVRIGSAVFEKM
ncbi:MAG: YggS family pyridoxal phosphate-dependent enzyme [Bacteroidia bacterium]